MSKLFLNSLIACAAMFPFSSSFAADLRVAIMDARALVDGSKQMVSFREELTKKFTTKRDAIVKKQESLKDDIKKFQANEKTMKKSTKTEKEKALMKRQQDLAEEERTFQAALYEEQNNGMQAIMAKVKKATEKVAKKKGYSMVLPKSDALYVSDNVSDATEEIERALKELD